MTVPTIQPSDLERILVPNAPRERQPKQHPAPCNWTRIEICGLPVDDVTMNAAVDSMMERLEARRCTRLYFLNADCVNIGHRDLEYRRTVQRGDLVFADGSGMRLAGRVLGTPIVDNVNGTDFFPRACARLAGSGHRVFLLGGRPGVAEKVRTWVGKHYPWVEICGTHHGYFDRSLSEHVAEQIRRCRTDVLFVAFGAPAQEKWIADHIQATGATVALGVGGLFDFYSGEMPRAPLWMRRAGIEWIHRFWREPRRLWKRYWIGNFVFMARVLYEAARRVRAAGSRPPAARPME